MSFTIYRLCFRPFNKGLWRETKWHPSLSQSELSFLESLQGDEYEEEKAQRRIRLKLLSLEESFYPTKTEAKAAWDRCLRQAISSNLEPAKEILPHQGLDDMQLIERLVAFSDLLEVKGMTELLDWRKANIELGPIIEAVSIQGVDNDTIIDAIRPIVGERLMREAEIKALEDEFKKLDDPEQALEAEQQKLDETKPEIEEIWVKRFDMVESMPEWLEEWSGDWEQEYVSAEVPSSNSILWASSKDPNILPTLEEYRRLSAKAQYYEDEEMRCRNEGSRLSDLRRSLTEKRSKLEEDL